MILSEKQLGITRRAKSKLEDELASLREAGSGDAEIEAMQTQIAEMEAQMTEYVKLKTGQVASAKFTSLENLPKALIQARIVSGMSQTELGIELGVKPQQIQRYEATRYMGASLARLINVAGILNIRVTTEYRRSAVWAARRFGR